LVVVVDLLRLLRIYVLSASVFDLFS